MAREGARDPPLDLIPGDPSRDQPPPLQQWAFLVMQAAVVARQHRSHSRGSCPWIENRLDTPERVVAASLAHSHESAEAGEKVRPKDIARHVRVQPPNRTHRMTVCCRRAGPGNLADRNLPRGLQRDNGKIAIPNPIAELVELRGDVQLLLWFRIRPGLLNQPEHSIPVLCGAEIAHTEPEDKLSGVERMCFLFSTPARASPARDASCLCPLE